jgi:hypothetical protein
MSERAWPREKLDLHVAQRIRERVDIALVICRDDEDNFVAMLREGGERSVWQVVQGAIREAGWKVAEDEPHG